MEDANLRSVSDQLQIQKVLALYCRGIDRCDVQLIKRAYWPDADEDHGIFQGKAWDFADFIVPLLKPMRATSHSISNVYIELRGDHAAVETYVTAYHLLQDADGAPQEMVVGGRYLDKFARREGEWRIAHRLFVMDWNQNAPATAVWDSGMQAQLKNRGQRDVTDLSYTFLAL